MDQITDNVAATTRYEMTAADHYRTAAMHHASAHTAIVDADKGELDAWKAEQQYERHMREAELHVQLANARNLATQLLLQDREHRTEDGAGFTQHEQQAVDGELDAWTEVISPRRPR